MRKYLEESNHGNGTGKQSSGRLVDRTSVGGLLSWKGGSGRCSAAGGGRRADGANWVAGDGHRAARDSDGVGNAGGRGTTSVRSLDLAVTDLSDDARGDGLKGGGRLNWGRRGGGCHYGYRIDELSAEELWTGAELTGEL
ncbi:hypothetical protein H2203_000482 [Taxawa tesnikishii (nom. ined.)]|nr:hypothetical protein H2203_000482 [Dothideales sp. JES 119]